MKTSLTTSPIEAAEFIKRGGVVAFPTETVYGLGANIFDERAIESIFNAKQRPADNPLIVHVGIIDQIETLAAEVTRNARELMDAFFPGPLTLVMRKLESVALAATAGLNTVGVRMPRHKMAREFLEACGVPVAAPSANLSGRPSPTTWQAVYEDLNGRIDCILQGEATEIGLESTVVDCTSSIPLVLRTGAVSLEQLRAVCPGTRSYLLVGDEKPLSPGMKHRHYSPRAKVGLKNASIEVRNARSAAYIGFHIPNEDFALVKKCSSVEEYAHSLFEFFRECDRRGVESVYCEMVEEKGIGVALMDRLRRAAD